MKRIDKIRQMSSEELAKVLVDISNCQFKDGCEECWLAESNGCYRPLVLEEWLEEEVQEDA